MKNVFTMLNFRANKRKGQESAKPAIDIPENNKHLVEGIVNYSNMQSSGALLITGVWGCGKTYFLKNTLFPYLENNTKWLPIMVSLYGLQDLAELPRRVIAAYLDKIGKSKEVGKASKKFSLGVLTQIGVNLSDIVPKIGEWVDVRKLIGDGHLLYKVLPKNIVIFFDDLERAIDKIEINDVLGCINDLVENLGYKVVVVANKDYMDSVKESDTKDNKNRKVFYEKVIEKDLSFNPDILGVYSSIVDSYNDANFSALMNHDEFKAIIDPSKAKKESQKILMENIRSLKFAISHFHAVYTKTKGSGILEENKKYENFLLNQWLFVYAISIELKQDKLSMNDDKGLSDFTPIASWDLDLESSKDVNFSENEPSQEKPSDIDFAKTFYDTYYINAQQYIFYQDIYKFVVGGVDFNIGELEKYTISKITLPEEGVSQGEENLDKLMNGFWNISNKDISGVLLSVLSAVEKGELSAPHSYYNASVFLFKLKELIDKTDEELLDIFQIGVHAFISRTEVTFIMRSQFSMLPIERGNVCDKVYDMISKGLDDKIKLQDERNAQSLLSYFNNDMQHFVSELIPNDQNSPKFAYTPILNIIDKSTIGARIGALEPQEVIYLDSVIRQRFQILGDKISSELQFYIDLRDVLDNRSPQKSLSDICIREFLQKDLRNSLANYFKKQLTTDNN